LNDFRVEFFTKQKSEDILLFILKAKIDFDADPIETITDRISEISK